MKIFKLFITAFIAAVALSACQKELSFPDNGTSSGALKKDGAGACVPITVNGIYKVDSILNASNFVDVQVNVSLPGTFEIKSDTVNGYSFRKVGSVVFGTNTIRLYATGKPKTAGTNTFTIKYGSSACTFDVTVIAAGSSGAVYTIGGAPGICTGAMAGGTYVAGVALAPSNTLTIQVNVSVVGYYAIGATTTNGFVFSGTGVFTLTGIQNVVLTGNGTPTTAGNTLVTVTNLTATCTYSVTVQPGAGGGTAAYTLSGTPNVCTGSTVNGVYTAGILATSANTVTLNVNVTATGTYAITTGIVNGFAFSKTGTFTATGAQTVTLVATGTPTVAGPFSFVASGNGSSSCSFSVNCNAAGPAGAFVLGSCSSITVAGTYAVGTPLTASNIMTVPVVVSTIGSYNITTNLVNGFIFTASGTFSATGAQNVVLTGIGIPLVAGTSNFTVTNGQTSSCTVPVTVTAGSGGTSIFQCKINGVLNTFTFGATGSYAAPGNFNIVGQKTATGFEAMGMNIDRSVGGFTILVPGTYTIAASTGSTYIIDAVYVDAATNFWDPNQTTAPFDPFTITITSISATRVVGTFSGTVRDNFSTGAVTKIITEGVFDLPVN
jgi:hypothetical protein